MTILTRDIRRKLEKTIKQARCVAENGAQKVLRELGVHHHEPYESMSSKKRDLRNRLRAHGRQLGDELDPRTDTQTIDHLIQECAYEHWHRMLFARFLAETELLIVPQSGVPITLEECRGLAREKDVDWLALASGYAESMLPQIFRVDDPVLTVTLPPETRSELEDLLKSLPPAVFKADDSLGWVYQFWQAEKKERVNQSGIKIGANELPAVTQLFTEDYMVLFLLHNTLGAWWAGKMLNDNPRLAISARDEDDLRRICRVGDIEWTYLRFVRDESMDGTEGLWRPAAGAFEEWPRAAQDITVFDPCMGSGHFLVFALPILIAFRMVEEGLDEKAAVFAVLRDNLFGLEIDPRCTQIAAFNLAFSAWRKIGYHALPPVNLACSGLAIGVTKEEWLRLAEKSVATADSSVKNDLMDVEDNFLNYDLEERLKNGLEVLHDLFAKAPWLGSLIDPRRADADIFREGFDDLEPLLASILDAADTDETREMAVVAQGMPKAAELLTCTFTLVITNPPFLGFARQGSELKNYIKHHHKIAKLELALSFLDRAIQFSSSSGSIAFVLPKEWTFVRTHRHFRKYLLDKSAIKCIAKLGLDSFTTPIRAQPILMISGAQNTSEICCILDITQYPLADKSEILKIASLSYIVQSDWLQQIDYMIVEISSNNSDRTITIGEFTDARSGLSAGDKNRFEIFFWEVPAIGGIWEFLQSSPSDSGEFMGRSKIVRWENENGAMAQLAESVRELNHPAQNWRRGKSLWGKTGLIISQIGAKVSIYTGERYDSTCFAIVPNDQDNVTALVCYGLNGELKNELRQIHPTWKLTSPKTLLQLPIDLQRWKEIASEKYPRGIPYDTGKHPAQWTFDGNLAESEEPLQSAIINLLGYRWPKQITSKVHSDDDGIVCLAALRGEPPAEQRIRALFSSVFDLGWSAAKLVNLLTATGYNGKSLDDWLRDKFFVQHCELFRQRPFIWHIWDGRHDGFHALVSYHRLSAPNGEGQRILSKLIYSYLGDWIDRQRTDQKNDVGGADARLAHAQHLHKELVKILEGEPPYDIFVRWKPLNRQPIGWDPDINDGVRLNIRPFMTARPLGARAKNACILRSTPKIKWEKDRGEEVKREKEDYPWFWGWDNKTHDFEGHDLFDGHRWNDLHYSRSFKQAARARRSAKAKGTT